jgi:Trypsin-like peptidase domain/CHAT domain
MTLGGGDSEVTDLVLRECTVRIDVRGAPKGSGFFVAPGHVITCAHVVESGLEGSETPRTIAVSDVNGMSFAVERVANLWEDVDLAVLRVVPANAHRCVLLISGQRMHDEFITFGYPEAHREGLARSLVAEGATGDDRLLSLAHGQVQPGMSGAPLLNTRTGGVCGVLRLTRDQSQDLGGYAIPIEVVSNIRSPTLARHNRAYHDAQPREWFDLLPPEQKRTLLDARPGAPGAGRFTHLFVVCIGGGKVSAQVHEYEAPTEGLDEAPAAEVETLPPEPADVGLVPYEVARLFRDWASRGRADPSATIPGRFDPGEDVRLLGNILYGAVLPDGIGDRFEELFCGRNHRIQLALYCNQRSVPRDFFEMPWEHLHVASSGVMGEIPVARSDKLAFVRVLSPEPREREEPSRRTLSALMVGITPDGHPGHSPVDEVLQRAEELAERLEGFDLQTLKMAGAGGLRDAMRHGRYDIVHYVGFGRYVGGADRIALGGVGGYEYLTADMFASVLAEQGPRVVVLQEIEGPQDIVPADFSVFAFDLLSSRVEAVVGYQFPLPAWLSVAFNQTFYEQLSAGQSFELAVQRARSELWTKQPELHAFVSPAAFVDQPGELRLTAAPGDSAPLARVGVTAAHA